MEDFVPYFVVYRYKDSEPDAPLCIHCFMTLYLLYAFIGENVERWSEYRVGRCLEYYGV